MSIPTSTRRRMLGLFSNWYGQRKKSGEMLRNLVVLGESPWRGKTELSCLPQTDLLSHSVFRFNYNNANLAIHKIISKRRMIL